MENAALNRISVLSSQPEGEYGDPFVFLDLYQILAKRTDENGHNLNYCYAEDELNLVWSEEGYLCVP